MTHCLEHPNQNLIFDCDSCISSQCIDCVDHRWVGDGFADYCRRCDKPLARVAGVAISADTPEEGVTPYLERIPEFLAFPFERSVMLMLVGLTLITCALRGLGSVIVFGAGYLEVMAFGLEAWVYFHLVLSTAAGHREIELPRFDYDELWNVLWRYFAALLPIIIGIIWLAFEIHSFFAALAAVDGATASELSLTGPGTMILVGVLFWPLLTIIAALSSSAGAVLHPVNWYLYLRAMGLSYVVGAILFYLVLAAETLIVGAVALLVLTHLDIPVITSLVLTLFAYLPVVIRARMLGALAQPHY